MEKVFEAKDNLYCGIELWTTQTEEGWKKITQSLDDLIRLMCYGEKELMEELTNCSIELGLTEDDVMDLDTSLRYWLENGERV